MSFQEKYLKYKSKYLDLKNQIGGLCTHRYKVGDGVIINGNVRLTNPFEDQIVSRQKAVIIELLPPHIAGCFYIVRLSGGQFNGRTAVEVTEQQIDNLVLRELTVGDRVRENDSQMTGTIIEIHDRWGHRNAVMKGDNGETYEHALWHFKQI